MDNEETRKRHRADEDAGRVEGGTQKKRLLATLERDAALLEERLERRRLQEELATEATFEALLGLSLTGESAHLSNEWDTHPEARHFRGSKHSLDFGVWPTAQRLGRSLAANTTLKHLAMQEVGLSPEVSDALLEALRVNRTLTSVSDWQMTLGPYRCPTRCCFAQALPFSEGLKTLRLFRPCLSDGVELFRGAQQLAEDLAAGLRANHSLTSLSLTHCQTIGQDASRALGAALGVNRTLSTLRLQTVTRDEADGAALATALGEALTANSTLTTLSLHGNRLGLPGLQSIVAALNVNHTLGSLDLSATHLTTEACVAFSRALRGNRGLHTVAFSHNHIGPEGARAFAEALRVNSRVTSLTLHACAVQDAGAEHLAGALGPLMALSLSSNGLTCFGAAVLARSLEGNRRLARLELWGNNIKIPGLRKLAQMMRSNFTLTSFIVTSGSDRPGREEQQRAIKSFVIKNRGQQLILQLTVEERIGEVLQLSFRRISGAVALELPMNETTTTGDLQIRVEEAMHLPDSRVRVQLPQGGLLDQQDRALPLEAILSPRDE